MRRFEGKNVLVTGASAGLGQAIAQEYAKEGARLLIADFQPADQTIRLIKEAGGQADFLSCDVTDEAQVVRMAQAAADAFDGTIDVLVNNAGFNGKAQLVQNMSLPDWEYTLRVNLTGTMLVCREIAPRMIARRQGAIVNVASNVARRGLPFRADYVCSKWALLGFTQTLALELVEHGIRVNAVCPGPIEGDRIEQVMQMHADAEGRSLASVRVDWENVPMKRFVEPEEVASAVLFLSSPASSAMTGQALNVTAGFIMT